MGPPTTTPKVPVKNMINAFGPSLKTSFKSILSVNKIKLAGNKYLEATKYSCDVPIKGPKRPASISLFKILFSL